MQLTSRKPGSLYHAAAKPLVSAGWALALICAGLLLVFALDRATETAPVQHLYYLPIILAAFRFGRRASLAVTLAAIILYHLADPRLIARRYGESDIIQIALFFAVGLVTAKFKTDAARLHLLAMTDDLTGLDNLRSFEPRLAGMVSDARRNSASLSLLVLDVDRLKALNDQHGHLAGAEAVQTVGGIIAGHLPPGAAACRFGGDEFAVALPHCSLREAEAAAARLCKAVNSAAPALAGRSFPAGTLSISVGLACHTFNGAPRAASSSGDDRQAGEALFRAADEALYAAKAGGRNRIAVA